MDSVEDSEGGEGELGHLEEDLPALTLGGLGTGAVGTEGDPVGCRGQKKTLATRKRKELRSRVDF